MVPRGNPTDRLLLILDLDETLIHARKTALDRPADFRVAQFHVYRRPGLDTFLRDVAQDFELAVWSSASDSYVEAIVENIFDDPSSLHFVWGRSRTSYQRIFSDSDEYERYLMGETVFRKQLKKVARRGWPLERILIVDDTPEKAAQNYGNAIYPRPYEGQEDDNELALLSAYLRTLKDVENVRALEKRNWRATVLKSG